MQEAGDYKAAAALTGVDTKYTFKTFNKFINTGYVLAAEKPLRVSTMLTKEHKCVRAQSALDSQLASLEVTKHAAWKPPQSTSQGKIPPFN
ncbi:hypothetical protein DSO57_1036850 [Entomophthora muscae]|uniref:Uncharacterized protein n=1 Tax=Entomophthora muscae TaxID=34485 RepID=A0ACC2T9Y1_9FUNG|nr:hypothetical protein DSO57_1036850 [Entomophthora muscae]